MPRSQSARDLQLIFDRAPWRSRLLFYAGVFCCFAPVGLLKGMQSLGTASWSYLAIEGGLSGLLAVGWAACAIHKRRWLPGVILATLFLAVGLRYWLPDPLVPDSLSGATLLAVKARLTSMSVATLYVVVLAYVAFVMFILGEGRRSFRAYTEIALAREIHGSLVPATSGATHDAIWRGMSRPSGDVGGDLVDVVADRGAWFGCVADVTGHGVAAGVLMGMFKTAVHASLLDARDVGDLISRVNRTLCPLTQPNMFVTCACLRIAGLRRIEYVLAGHPSFLHVSKRSGQASWVGSQQLALALRPETTYTSALLDVEPGDLIVVITDGLLEVFDARGREFGADGVAAVIRPLATRGLDEIEAAVFAAAQRHGGQTDDQTMLLLRLPEAV